MSRPYRYEGLEEIVEKDWELFRSRLPGWREAYVEQLLRKYDGILHADSPASERFWALEKRVRQDKWSFGVVLTERKRSAMRPNLAEMLEREIITEDDLDGFSEELREALSWGAGKGKK